MICLTPNSLIFIFFNKLPIWLESLILVTGNYEEYFHKINFGVIGLPFQQESEYILPKITS